MFRLLKAPKSRQARPGPLLFAQHSFAIGSTMQNNDFSFLLSAQKHTDSTKKKKMGMTGLTASAFFIGGKGPIWPAGQGWW